MVEQYEADRAAWELEYKAIRDEILLRIDLRQKLVALNLIFAAALLGFSANNHEYQLTALIYPPLATLMSIAWIQDDYGIRDAAIYVREHIEKKIPALGWEHYKKGLRAQSRWHSLILLSHQVIIILTQIMAIFIGTINTPPRSGWFGKVDLFLVIDCLSIIVVIYLCTHWWLSNKSITEKGKSILAKIWPRSQE